MDPSFVFIKANYSRLPSSFRFQAGENKTIIPLYLFLLVQMSTSINNHTRNSTHLRIACHYCNWLCHDFFFFLINLGRSRFDYWLIVCVVCTLYIYISSRRFFA